MKNKQMETKLESALRVTRHLFNRVVCLGAVILICSTASAQNLFRSDGLSGISHDLGNIYKFTPGGVESTFATGLDGPEGLAFDRAGNLFVASFLGNIYKFTPGGARSTFASGLNNPLGMAFDRANNLFVADEGSGNIFKYTPSGVRTIFASGLNQPLSLAFDLTGNLFVASGGSGDIYKFNPNGARSTFASGLVGPWGLAFDSGDNLFVTDWGSGVGRGTVYKFTTNGVRSTFAKLSAPLGLAFDSAGILFVADEDSGNIYKFNPNGVRSTFAKGVIGLDETGFLAFQPTPTSDPGQLQNISTRAFMQTGDNVMIGGFIITGSGQKKVILRAIGPSLVDHGITNPLQNPTLELHDHTGAVIASNDNWMDAPNKQEIINSGLAPTNNLESAILTSLNPGAYTAIVRGVNNGTGIALVEGYDLDPTAGSKLGNISTRALVQTGDNVMIGGIIITGPDSDKVIVRAIGPSLAQHAVTNPLHDPTLELYNGNGAVIAFNDNWKESQEAEIQATGLVPSNDAEPAIVQTLEPGNYTAIVRGKNDTIGVALVEVYGLN